MRQKMIIWVTCSILFTIGLIPVTVFGQTSAKPVQESANLVVFVQFEPLNPQDPKTNFMNTKPASSAHTYTKTASDIFFSLASPKSLENYLSSISYGQFHVNNYLPQYENDQITPLVLSADLVADGRTDDYPLVNAVIRELSKVSLPQSGLLDRNNDNILDNLTIIAQGSDSGVLASHKADYSGNDTVNGKLVKNYNILSSKAAFETGHEGVVAHEFLHTIGYPDLYKKSASGMPVGPWDIMASTSPFPQYPLAYLRSKISGWLSIKTITADTKGLTLNPATKPQGDQAYILKSPLSDQEFFVVEYRQKGSDISGLEYKLPGTGLIVYRIDTRSENLSNVGNENGVVILGEGISGSATEYSQFASTFFSQESGRTSFGSRDLDERKNILAYSDGSNSGIEISKIGSAGDTITFDVSFADTEGLGLWQDCGSSAITKEPAANISMDKDSKGSLYVSYTDDRTQLPRCKKWNGTSWDNVSSQPITSTKAYNGSLVLYKDTPYFLYNDKDYNLQLSKYEGSTWKNCGTVNGGLTQFYAATAAGDGLYIGYSSGDQNYSYHLKKFNGTSFSETAASIAAGSFANIALTASGQDVYMGLRDFSSNKPVVKKITGATVTDISPKNFSSSCQSLDLAAASGKLCLSASNADGLAIYKYNGADWYLDGRLEASSSIDHSLDSADGVLYAVNIDQNQQKIKAWYRNGSQWKPLGYAIPSSNSSQITLANSGSMVYTAFLEARSGDMYPVIKRLPAPVDVPQVPDEPPAKPTPTPTPKPTPKPKPVLAPGQVTGLKTTSMTTTSAALSWKRQANADTYQIYRSSSRSGRFTLVGTTKGSKVTFKNTRLASGRKYYYRVRAGKRSNNAIAWGRYSNVLESGTHPGKVSLSTASKKKKVVLRWKKVSGADGYEIYQSKSKNGKYKKIKTCSAKYRSYTLKGYKKGKRYYYKTRAYKTIGGKKYYGNYSLKKSAKAKR